MPNTYNIKLTFSELQDVVAGLKEHRDRQYLTSDVEHYVKYSWAVTDAEASLVKRARIAELIFQLTGERIEEDPEHSLALAEAKKLKAELEALEAEEAARENQEV
jgi:hypothetical protein